MYSSVSYPILIISYTLYIHSIASTPPSNILTLYILLVLDLHVLSNVEDLLVDDTPLDIKFLESIGSLTSLKTLSLSNCGMAGTLPSQDNI